MLPKAVASQSQLPTVGNKPTHRNHGTSPSVVYMRLNVTTIKKPFDYGTD